MADVSRDEFNEIKTDIHELNIVVAEIKKDVEYIKNGLEKLTDIKSWLMLVGIGVTSIGAIIMIIKYFSTM